MSEEIPEEQNQVPAEQASLEHTAISDETVQHSEASQEAAVSDDAEAAARAKELHARENMQIDNVMKDPDLMKAILHDPEGLTERLKAEFAGKERDAGYLVDDTFNVLRKEVMGAQYGHDEAGRIFEGVSQNVAALVTEVHPQLDAIGNNMNGLPEMVHNFSGTAISDAKAALTQIENFLNEHKGDPEEIKHAVHQLKSFSDQYHRFHGELAGSAHAVADSSRRVRGVVEEKKYGVASAKSEMDMTFQDMSYLPASQVSDEMIHKVARSGFQSFGAFRAHRQGLISQKEETINKTHNLMSGLEDHLDTFARLNYQTAGVVEEKLPLPNRVTDAAQEFDRVLYGMAQHGDVYRGQLDQLRYEFVMTVNKIQGELEYIQDRAVSNRQQLADIRGIVGQLQSTIQKGSQETF